MVYAHRFLLYVFYNLNLFHPLLKFKIIHFTYSSPVKMKFRQISAKPIFLHLFQNRSFMNLFQFSIIMDELLTIQIIELLD